MQCIKRLFISPGLLLPLLLQRSSRRAAQTPPKAVRSDRRGRRESFPCTFPATVARPVALRKRLFRTLHTAYLQNVGQLDGPRFVLKKRPRRQITTHLFP